MPPLYVLLQLLLAGLLAGAGFVWLRGVKEARTRWLRIGALVAAGIATWLLDLWLNKRPDLYLKLLPFPDALFFDNWLPYGAALLAPAAMQLARSGAQAARLGVLLTVLFTLSWKPTYDEFRPLARTNPLSVDPHGIVRQTSSETCAAAALATFARQYGIDATEAQMVEHARTLHRRGTTQLGLYRALRLAFAGREELKPRIVKAPAGWLLRRSAPAIITVGLPRDGSAEARAFGQKYDWPQGIYHDVVFLGPDPEKRGHVLIGEPDSGLESWPIEHLKYLYSGFAAVVE